MILSIFWAKGKVPRIRRIAGLEAIDEAVGRATEMGKPVLFTPGFGDVATSGAAPTIAGLDMMGYVGRLTAKHDTKIISTVGHPNTYALAEEVLRNAYIAEGKGERLPPDAVTFGTEIQFAYTAATLGLIQRDKPAACMFLGSFAAEAIVIAEAAVAIGAISIAGSTNHFQLPFFVAACDYTLIGEEFLAAGAYVSQDVRRIATIAGQDWVKLFAVVAMLAGAILATGGNRIVHTWLGR